MGRFVVIVLSIPLLHLFWWWWADKRVRSVRQPVPWRIALAAFSLFQLGFFIYIIGGRMVGLRLGAPAPLMAMGYLWDLLILPFSVIVIITGLLFSRAWRLIARKPRPASNEAETLLPETNAAPKFTRREVLALGVAALPPLTNAGTALIGLSQMDEFRIRTIDIPLKGLPRELDGMSIAHISDVHVGKFTKGETLRQIVRKANDLKADLVLLTGDLIDFAIRDLPAAIEMVKKLDPRSGLFMCEGNHDLFEDRIAFEQSVKRSGIPLLINEAETVTIRGRDVQILGLKWGGVVDERRDAGLITHVAAVDKLRDPDAFQILLAHHPHAFDYATNYPLTLAGHTHGGQLMVTEKFGAGPAMFKYWSGLYQQDERAIVVSNGVGNWFPIRTSAPAEIVHIRLRSAA